MQPELWHVWIGGCVQDPDPTGPVRAIAGLEERKIRLIPIADLGVVAVFVDHGDVEMRRQAFNVVPHLQQQELRRTGVGPMIPLEENEFGFLPGPLNFPPRSLWERLGEHAVLRRTARGTQATVEPRSGADCSTVRTELLVKISDGLLKPFAQLHPWLPAQLLSRQRDVGLALQRIVLRRGA